MEHVSIEPHGDVALLRLTNGVTNAIGPIMVDYLFEALEAVRSDYRGMILAGGDKFFSMGLDLPLLLTLGEDEMATFFDRFNAAAIALYTLPIPTFCVMAGHAIAGGTILALTCDFRFAIAEKKMMGLNEVKLGVPVPYLADLMLRQIVGDRQATPVMFGGEFLSFPDAHRIGLVHETASIETLEDRALHCAATLAAHPPAAFAETKASRTETIRALYEQYGKAKNKAFLRCWFSPEGQKLLRTAAEKF
jgi:enoyl-CoA hydratase/carnithine racemase